MELFKPEFLAKLGLGEKEKRRLPLLFLLLAVGLLLMGLSSWLSRQDRSGVPYSSAEAPPQAETEVSEERALEQKLAEILGKIRGAGEVSVALTFAESGRTDYAVNASTTLRTTEENDQNGGVRSTTEQTRSDDLVLAEGNSNPVAVRRSSPEVQGVLVVAAGADDPAVCRQMAEALQNLLDIPAHKIVICPAD